MSKIKKKRTKKHNPNIRAQRFFNNVRLWSWESMVEGGERISHGEARAGFIWKPLTQQQVDGLIKLNNNWAVCCRALCRVGNEVWVETSIRSARDIKINDFAFLYDQLRTEVFEAVQTRHVIDCGWIVQSFGKRDRIDDNFEMAYLGDATNYRRQLWLEGLKIKEVSE